jgi:hypothetical protein
MTSNEIERVAVVTDLLLLTRSLKEIAERLAAIDWDYEGDGVELTRHHLISVLQRFLDAELAASDIESWANLVEVREDIYFQAGCKQRIEETLYELANPTLTQPLDRSRASALLDALG